LSQAPSASSKYGEGYLVTQSLTQLLNMWIIIDDSYKQDVVDLASEVYRIAKSLGGLSRINWVYQEHGVGLNNTEIVLFAGHMLAASTGRVALDRVNEALADLYGGEPDDGTMGNAFKHAYWSALLVESIGYKNAKLFADAHEFGARYNLNTDDSGAYVNLADMYMDLHNNAIGRSQSIELKTSAWVYLLNGLLPTEEMRRIELRDTLLKMANNGHLMAIKQ